MKIIASIFLLLIFGCNSKAQTDKANLDSLVELALKADSLNDYKTSILYYNQILDIDSISLLALVNRGKALIAISKIDDGFADLSKAIKHYPHEQTYYSRAVAYMYLNKLDSAQKDLKAAKNINPLFADIYYAFSNLHLMREEYLPALSYLEQADKFGMNENFSTALKVEMSKIFGDDVVINFNYDRILNSIKNLPLVKKAEEKSLSKTKHGLNYGVKLNKITNWIYIITVRKEYEEKILWEFKVDAATLKVLNPDGKN